MKVFYNFHGKEAHEKLNLYSEQLTTLEVGGQHMLDNYKKTLHTNFHFI